MIRRIAREEARLTVLGWREDVVRRLQNAVRTELDAASAETRAEAGRTATEVARTLTRQATETLAEDYARVVTEVGKLARHEAEQIVRHEAELIARTEVERVAISELSRSLVVHLTDDTVITLEDDMHAMLPKLALALNAGCHVLLVGPAGTGKSTMARQAAAALGLEFHALSVGPTTPTSKLFGYLDAQGNYHRTPLRDAYEHGGLMLLDELDNGHPGLLTELNQALSLDVCAFADGMIPRHDGFRLVATANTYGHGGDRQYVGRQPLDAATLDRLITLDIGIDETLETKLTLAHAPSRPEAAQQALSEVRRLRRAAAQKQIPVVLSPRAAVNAARLLEAGLEMSEAIEWSVVKGMSDAHRTALGVPPARR